MDFMSKYENQNRCELTEQAPLARACAQAVAMQAGDFTGAINVYTEVPHQKTTHAQTQRLLGLG